MAIPGITPPDFSLNGLGETVRGAVRVGAQTIGIGGFDDALESIVRGGRSGVAEAEPRVISGTVAGNPSAAVSNGSVPQWGRLNPALIARFFAMKPDESNSTQTFAYVEDPDVGEILAPISDAMFDMTMNWQSVFEQSGPESKAPALMALIQTGQAAQIANALQRFLPAGASEAIGDFTEASKKLRGKTGITKLNSVQAFTGMPPIKFTMKLHFRAVTDELMEVVEPYQRLLEWASPQKLSKDGFLVSAATTGDAIKALFPSDAPRVVGFDYGGFGYFPLVIERVGNPIDSPMSGPGKPLYRVVDVNLATLTALDREDIKAIFSRSA